LAVVVGLLVGPSLALPAYGRAAQLSGETVTYVPPAPPYGGESSLDQAFTVTGGSATSPIHVSVNRDTAPLVRRNPSGGGPSYCDPTGGSTFTCPAMTSGSIVVQHARGSLRGLVSAAGSADVMTTVAIAETGESASAAVRVRPRSDLRVRPVVLLGLSSTQFAVQFNVINNGPSGAPKVTVTVSGFLRRPPPGLPTGCQWSAPRVTCTLGSTQDIGGWNLAVPIGTDRQCRYTVTLKGIYPDPLPSNNTGNTSTGTPCSYGGQAPAPSQGPPPGGGGGTPNPLTSAPPAATPPPSVTPSAAQDVVSPSPSSIMATTPDLDATNASAGRGGATLAWMLGAGLGALLIVAAATIGALWMRRTRPQGP
jgi:hypothetical protein